MRIINAKRALNIGARRITISTCGVVPQMRQLMQEGLQVDLAVSLHGSNNASRNILMPVNRRYPFDRLIDVCREYVRTTKRQVTFEYILIKEVTCSDKVARTLRKTLKGLICKMNLIPYNRIKEFDYATPSKSEARRFKDQLKEAGIHATIRRPREDDVAAACGQLRHTYSGE